MANKGKLTESKKAQMGAAGIAVILGLISQGLSPTIAAYIIGALVALEIISWVVQDKNK